MHEDNRRYAQNVAGLNPDDRAPLRDTKQYQSRMNTERSKWRDYCYYDNKPE